MADRTEEGCAVHDRAEEDETTRIARMLADGVTALKSGRFDEAAQLLGAVCDAPSFAAATDLLDVRGRASSLCAEALLLAGHPEQAMPRIDAALALARRAGDIEGISEVERLQERIRRAPRPSAQRIPQLPPTAATDPAERLLQEAAAALDAGQRERAQSAADRAIAIAADRPRIAVIGRILRAKAEPSSASRELNEAAALARSASEPTLLALVIKTAELLSIALDPGDAPHRHTRRGSAP